MKRSVKAGTKRGATRELFAELSEGLEALAEARHGKRTLRTQVVEYKPAPRVTPQELIRVRKNLNQAALLINLVKRYPDTVQRLATIRSHKCPVSST